MELSIIFYFVAGMSVWTFLLFGIDKWQAIHRGRRISEKTLFFFTLIGGSPGALLGMNIFRHKTSKTSFQFVVALILLLQIGFIFFFANLS